MTLPAKSAATAWVAGFDGALHYSVDRFNFANLGVEDQSNARLPPRAVFWHGAKTDGWLLAALRRQEALVVRDQKNPEDGRRVVNVTSEWQRGEQQWRYEISVLPEHSWLPVSTKIFVNDENVATEVIEELASNDDGIWYPARIKWTQKVKPHVTVIRQTTIVTSFSVRNDFTDRDFTYSPPFGTAIVDYRLGVTWYHDPWWSELAPWIKEQFGWPEPDLSAIRELQSYAAAELEGQPAPPILAAEWLNDKNPGPWDRKGRRTTVLFFFGGRAISPTPKYLSALKALDSRYKDHGLEVIGVVTSSNEPERPRQAMQELQVSFPVAIDSPNADGKGYGQTFAAYGLRSYVGVFVIDPAGRVHLVNPTDVPAESQISALEHVLKSLAQGAVEVDTSSRRRLPDAAAQKIGEEWKRRAAMRKGTARITGRIEATADDRDVFIESRLASKTRSGVPALIQATPMFQILPSGSPFDRRAFYDRNPVVELATNDDGTFELTGLCRGEYRVNIIVPGLARTERTITLANDHAEVNVSVVLNQGDVITGTVVDSGGTPIVGASIEFRNLYVGAYTFHVTASGFEAQDAQPITAGTQNARIVLRKSGESKD
ncbi:MAG: redoxin domain-containing protein [Fuerstiella sp.]